MGKNGDHFDLQDASLDWLITDSRRSDMTEPSPQQKAMAELLGTDLINICLLYTSPSPRDGLLSRMPSSA